MDKKVTIEQAIEDITRQKDYVTQQHAKSLREFPNNIAAHASWFHMIEAYEISLQILRGEEV